MTKTLDAHSAIVLGWVTKFTLLSQRWMCSGHTQCVMHWWVLYKDKMHRLLFSTCICRFALPHTRLSSCATFGGALCPNPNQIMKYFFGTRNERIPCHGGLTGRTSVLYISWAIHGYMFIVHTSTLNWRLGWWLWWNGGTWMFVRRAK